MREEQIVQFVCFETVLDTDKFIVEWEQYTRHANSDSRVTLQQSEKNGLFRYIAQHRTAREFEFIFTRTRRSKSQTAAVPIKTEQLGGYTILQSERTGDTNHKENKVFVFLTSNQSDLNLYRQMSYGKLNIYEAYYENCRYAYILEFFIKNEFCNEFIHQLKQYSVEESGVYKECDLQLT
jgi:hypothetical protein